MKKIIVNENDLKQIQMLTKIIAEGKYEIKGDAVLMVAQNLRWLAELADRIKRAEEDKPVEPLIQESPNSPTKRIEKKPKPASRKK